MTTLQPMSVNNGDPVTAELMQSIIANINLINSTTNVKPGGGPSLVFQSGRNSVSCAKDSSGELSITFPTPFGSRPNVICSISNLKATSLLTLKYAPVVTDFSETGFTVQMVSLGATSGGSVMVHWIATGNKASS
jgi:hypothetical protein